MKLYQVDAFTDRPFSGNPAGVCLLEKEMPGDWMQAVASEMNLSETAFLLKKGDLYSLRWFTPLKEVDLCGHATLASAHILLETGMLGPGETARFDTRSGILAAKGAGGVIEMDFPAEPVRECEPPRGLIETLGIKPLLVARNRMDYLVEAASEQEVRGLRPDLALLKAIETRGVMVTSRADTSSSYDFVSRFFAPAYGIDEDPVTGSAHCALGPYWMERLGRDELTGYQASARGGTVRVRVMGERVMLGGQAVTMFEADLRH